MQFESSADGFPINDAHGEYQGHAHSCGGLNVNIYLRGANIGWLLPALSLFSSFLSYLLSFFLPAGSFFFLFLFHSLFRSSYNNYHFLLLSVSFFLIFLSLLFAGGGGGRVEGGGMAEETAVLTVLVECVKCI